MKKITGQGRSYMGLLGLDGNPVLLKTLNFIITVFVGGALALVHWYRPMHSGGAAFDLQPFAWPVIILFAWPVGGVILWLRINGLLWSWSICAGFLVIALYNTINYILDLFASFYS